jgi:hypothetical protein
MLNKFASGMGSGAKKQVRNDTKENKLSGQTAALRLYYNSESWLIGPGVIIVISQP